MIKRLSGAGYILLLLLLGVTTRAQAQITTSTFQDYEVKENSIVVIYDDADISVKGKSVSPQILAAEIKAELGVTIATSIPRKNTEEWIIGGDMQSVLKRLNNLPGVKAFPNYVFKRSELDGTPVPQGGSPNQLTPQENAANRTKPVINKNQLKSLSLGEVEFTPLATVYEEDFTDSATVAVDWLVQDWSGSGTNWEIVSDEEGGYYFELANTADTTAFDIASDAYSPILDLSVLDTTKKYRLRMDIDNGLLADAAFAGLYFEGSESGSDYFEITGYDEFIWVDITSFVGEQFYFDVYVETPFAEPGEFIFAIDNIVIEEYPVNDTFIHLQYALYNDGLFNPGYSVPGADISAFDAWETTTGSEEVVVVVYDDGVDFDHEDLVNQAWVNPGEIAGNGIDDDGNGYIDDIHGWSAVYNDNSYLNPGSFHGTHVAGIVGAEGGNGIGVSGVAQDVSIISVMIFDEFGSTDAISIMRGYDYISSLLEQDVDIIAVNQSWGGGNYMNYESAQQFYDVMTGFALDHSAYGTVWVVSAGNDEYNRDELPFYSYPNNIQAPNILTVASTDDGEALSGFSDFGVRTVDIGAPGSEIASTFPANQYYYLSGTSMASPQVTGAMALAKSVYPDESGMELMVRVLAGAEILPQYEGVFGEGGRLNANAALDPSLEGFAAGLVPSHSTAMFHRTFADEDGFTSVGFVNNTDEEVTVTGVSISGTDADKFYSPADLTETLVPAGGAYSVVIGFDNAEEDGEFTATATIETTGDNVEIALNGREQGFADIYIDPMVTDLGGVAHGGTIEATFNIVNPGNKELNFEIGQELMVLDEEMSDLTESLNKVEPVESSVQNKESRFGKELFNELAAKVKLQAQNAERRKVSYQPGSHPSRREGGAETVFFDDLNDPDVVAENWLVFDLGFGDIWELYDVGSEDVNNVFLFGDFTTGYLEESATVALSPIFDFSALEDKVPSYLVFDVETSLEEGYDYFWVELIIDGEFIEIIADTDDGSIINNGGYYTTMIDISSLAGASNVEFHFYAYSDISFAGGFGALFDNVEIIVDDVPYFTSVEGGTVEAGGSQEVTVTVNTGKIPAGEYVLYTDVFHDGFISYYPSAPYHTLFFDARNVNLSIDPIDSFLGEVDPGVNLEYNFEATNTGALDLDYYADVILLQEQGLDAAFEEDIEISAEAAEQRFGAVSSKEAAPFNPLSHKELILDKLTSVNLKKSQSSKTRKGRDFLPTVQATDLLFEDFEEGLPEDWQVFDYSFGLGDVFEVENIGTEEDPYNALIVSDYSPTAGYFIHDNTVTMAFSPMFDLSSVPPSEDIYLNFTYSFLLEPGFDFASVWVGYTEDDVEYLELIGSSEDVFLNDGGEYLAQINLSRGKGLEDVYIAFAVETDISVQSGWAYFDNLDVFTSDKVVYIDPQMGTIDSSATQQFDVTVNTPWLYPGDYVAASFVDYMNAEVFIGRSATHYAYFSIANEAPVAVNDTIAVLAGEEIILSDLFDILLSNDSDEYGMLDIYDFTDPLYGKLRYLGGEDWGSYVAPLNYEGYDHMRYIVTDGEDTDTAEVYISVSLNPAFVPGGSKQFVFLEDESLTFSTIGLAAGVGGMDEDLIVWGESESEDLIMSHDGTNHTMTLSATDDFFGQVAATFYVGYGEGEEMDSKEFSIVIVPVNDAPEAAFTFTEDENPITFTDTSSDAKDAADGGIIEWAWDFGDGTTSDERNPIHVYTEVGNYNVTLTVTDNGGLTSTVTQEIPISVSSEGTDSPIVYALQQNYPNPFNPSTLIEYSIPEAGKVSIVVYDMLGQKVAELVNSTKTAGEYSVRFNAAQLSSGIYIYQIRAGSFTQTKKMTLIK